MSPVSFTLQVKSQTNNGSSSAKQRASFSRFSAPPIHPPQHSFSFAGRVVWLLFVSSSVNNALPQGDELGVVVEVY